MGSDSVDERQSSVLDAFVDLADSLVADYDPLDFLCRLLDHGVPLTQADAGAVLLHYEGRLHLVASSSEESENIELFELQNDQGPARDAFHAGEPILLGRVADATDRWPQFAEAAAPYGWTSGYAVPLRLRDHIAGSFVVFWSEAEPQRPSNDDAKLLQGFADVATVAVLQRRAAAEVEKVNDQLHVALESRIKVEQAKGIVAQYTGMGMDDAFQVLRRHARSTNQRLAHVAGAVATGDLDIGILTRP